MLEQLHYPEDEDPAEVESPQLDPQGNLRSEVVRPTASLIHIEEITMRNLKKKTIEDEGVTTEGRGIVMSLRHHLHSSWRKYRGQ